MKTDKKRILQSYDQALPDIFRFQFISKSLLGLWLFLLGKLSEQLLRSSGRPALTSGDFTFLFTSWQGILVLLIGLASMFVYVATDLNAQIVLSRELLAGSRISVTGILREGFVSVRKLIAPKGFLALGYLMLIAPILGMGLSVSATKDFYIPSFIAEVIRDTPLYLVGVSFLVLVFLSVGVANLFFLHGIVLDDLAPGEAGIQSKQLIRKNWQDYLRQNLLFVVFTILILGAVTLLFLIIPLALIETLPLSPAVGRLLTILFVVIGVLFSLLVDLMITPVYLIRMTQLFLSYKQGEPCVFRRESRREHHKAAAVLETVLVIGILAVAVFSMNRHFDELFPLESSVEIIAHRAGGIEAAENTLAGFDAAWKAGAYGSETDVQRTKDGAYILNHDANFSRVANNPGKPEAMTLAEVRTLSVDGESVPTLEEALNACRGRIILFIELKGATADRQMADDVVRMVRDMDMADACVLISLDYDLIDYIESTYPEMQTGFLLFAAYGEISDLNCDCLAVEEETATPKNIAAIHRQGKKVLVWTVNRKESQKKLLCSNVDGIITDHVSQAVEIRNELSRRTDFQRMIDRIHSDLS